MKNSGIIQIFFDKRKIILCPKNEFTTKNGQKDNLIYEFTTKKEIKVIISLFKQNLHLKSLTICASDFKKLKKAFFSNFKVLKAAGGLVKNCNNELLVIKRNGKWDLPKGHVEKGEKIKAAAIREVSEECGISGIEIKGFLANTYHTYYIKNRVILKETYWYLMSYNGNETLKPQIDEGITEVIWSRKEKLNEILENTYESLKLLFSSSF